MKSLQEVFFPISIVIMLFIITFAPETFGVSFKYVSIPFVLLMIYAFFNLKLKNCFRLEQFFIVLFTAIIVVSTVTSDYVKVEPKFRSLILMVLLYLLVSSYTPSKVQIIIIKKGYVFCSFLCGLWIVYSIFSKGLFGLDRYNFEFVYFRKDVNYLFSFMLPAVYLSARELVILHNAKNKLYHISNIVMASLGILGLQCRGAMLTFLICSALLYLEYNLKSKFSFGKIVVVIILIVVVLMVYANVNNSDNFSRFTDKEGYEDNIRLFIWECALQAYYNNPILGSGLGASSMFSERATDFQSHNNYIDIIGDFGILGLACFIILAYYFLKVPSRQKLNMLTYSLAFLLPLGFINGFQTISFWMPMYLIVIERNYINSISHVDIYCQGENIRPEKLKIRD